MNLALVTDNSNSAIQKVYCYPTVGVCVKDPTAVDTLEVECTGYRLRYYGKDAADVFYLLRPYLVAIFKDWEDRG